MSFVLATGVGMLHTVWGEARGAVSESIARRVRPSSAKKPARVVIIVTIGDRSLLSVSSQNPAAQSSGAPKIRRVTHCICNALPKYLSGFPVIKSHLYFLRHWYIFC